MKKLNMGPLILGSIGMLVVILDGKTAVTGVRDGVQLCLNTLIPSLFPFFVLSSLVTASLAGHSIGPLRSVCKFCRMSSGCESFLAVGILGGYPVGAANIAGEVKSGRLSKQEAERMTIFCNNAGPSFLFGILGPLFPNPMWVWLLWAVQIGASVLTGFFLPSKNSETISLSSPQKISLSDSLNRGIKSMASVCGWVILFRMILEFLRLWVLHLLPVPMQVLVTAILELSNGCLALSGVENVSLRFLMAGAMLSIGGICVWMQTQAVFPLLNLDKYIRGRILHCFICLLLSGLILLIMTGIEAGTLLPWAVISGAVGIFLLLVLRKPKIAVAFYHFMMYNVI